MVYLVKFVPMYSQTQWKVVLQMTVRYQFLNSFYSQNPSCSCSPHPFAVHGIITPFLSLCSLAQWSLQVSGCGGWAHVRTP